MALSQTVQNTHRVQFPSDGIVLRGDLYLPRGDGPHALVILGHGFAGLKEWTLPEIAISLSKVGIAALLFDFRNFGDSDGEPREEVDHLGRLEDWRSAISFVQGLPEVDGDRIGLWGTSLGGRDVLVVAALDPRVKAVVSQAPLIKWTAASAAHLAGYGDDLEQYYIDLGKDHANRALGNTPRYVPFIKASNDEKKALFIDSLTAEEKRNYSGSITLQSYKLTVMTNVIAWIKHIPSIPLLFILAEEDSLPGQKDAYNAANEPKELVVIKGHHFSPYTTSKPESIAATTKFFSTHLATR